MANYLKYLEYASAVCIGGFFVYMYFALRSHFKKEQDQIRLENYGKILKERDENRNLSLPDLVDKVNRERSDAE